MKMISRHVLLIFTAFLLFSFSMFSCRPPVDDDNDERILPDDIYNKLSAVSSSHSTIARLRIVGYSSGPSPFPIYALKLTDNPDDAEDEPEFQFTGGIHGNEQASVMFVLDFIDYLVDAYADNDPDAVDIINNHELHFFPSLNPYGLSQDIRYNANTVDLNRNCGWAWVSQAYHGAAAFDQPETQALRDDSYEHPYAISIHGHTGTSCLNYLWDYIGVTNSSGTPATYTEAEFTANYLPTYPLLEDIATAYYTSVFSAGDADFWITEGYDWYPVFGSVQDWQYGEQGTLAFTVEYDASFNHTELNTLLFSDIFNWHKDAIIALIRQTDMGIRGVITGTGGVPIKAKVSTGTVVKGVYSTDPVTYSPFAWTDPDAGDYHMVVQPGTYDLAIEADGYTTAYIYGLVVPDDPGYVIQNVQLTAGTKAAVTRSVTPVIVPENVPPDLRGE